mmetsp:Transcript_16131/g.48629  ORF Transcript_16131/g.48629 Transcript_16131/m.48629 type:complete len:246 (+) Transcript_16131:33-770(+)
MRTGLRSWDCIEDILAHRRNGYPQPADAELKLSENLQDASSPSAGAAEDKVASVSVTPHVIPALPRSSPAHLPGGAADRPAQQQPRRCALERWLLEIDPEGRLACYLGIIQENFDALHQITDTYVSIKRPRSRRHRDQGGEVQHSADKMLDRQLFDDLGIEDREHQDLIRAWFDAKLGARCEDPPPPPPVAPPPEEAVEDAGEGRDDGYCYWPQDIPREQQNRARRLMHSSVKAWYPRERVHGPQ